MAKNTNYHRADVTLLQSENARLQEEKRGAGCSSGRAQAKAGAHDRGLRQCPTCAVRAVPARRGGMSWAKTSCGLFNEAETVQDHKAPEPTEADLTVKAHTPEEKADA